MRYPREGSREEQSGSTTRTGRIASVEQAWKTICARGLAGESGRPAPQRGPYVRTRLTVAARGGRPVRAAAARRQRTRAVVPRRRTQRGLSSRHRFTTREPRHRPSKENTIGCLQAAGSGGGGAPPPPSRPCRAVERRLREKPSRDGSAAPPGGGRWSGVIQ